MSRLINKKEVMEKHPALNKKWRIDWLIRSRQIPIVKIGRRVYFEEEALSHWIEKNSIPALKENTKNGQN